LPSVDTLGGCELDLALPQHYGLQPARATWAAEAKVLLLEAIAIAEKAVPAGKLLSTEVSNQRGIISVIHIAKDSAVSAVHVDFADGRIIELSDKLDD
jgi:hypothetical protein